MSRGLVAVMICLVAAQIAVEMWRARRPPPASKGEDCGATSFHRAEGSHQEWASRDAVVREGGRVYVGSPPASIDLYNKFPEFELPFNITQCTHVYLDLGTNQGWQLEKLFFGAKPHSKWAKKFATYFHADYRVRQRMVCALGAEPNPVHKSVLDKLEGSLERAGVRVKILRNPVWVNNDMMLFGAVYDPNNNHDAGSLATKQHIQVFDHNTRSINQKPNITRVQVRAFRLSTLLAQLDPRAMVVAKLDVEGAEHRIITDILLDGTICRIRFFGVEIHPHLMTEDMTLFTNRLGSLAKLNALLEQSKRCPTWVRDFDDEL